MNNRDKSHTFSLQERLRSFIYAGSGLRLLMHEHNAWIHLAATIGVVVVGLLVRLPLTHWAIVTLAIGGVWIAEAINTCIERLCDHVTPEQHAEIGRIKDISAAAVVLAAITAVLSGLCIFMPPIIEWCKTLFS